MVEFSNALLVTASGSPMAFETTTSVPVHSWYMNPVNMSDRIRVLTNKRVYRTVCI